MSAYLWKYYIEDDPDSFCQLLEEVASGRPHTHKGGAYGHAGSYGLSAASPGGLTASPVSSFRTRHSTERPPSSAGLQDKPPAEVTLTRADVNRKDAKGLTILHYTASSVSENAKVFAMALIAHPLVDLYAQDLENGWTPLHRAFYFGNITIARAIIEKDAQNPRNQNFGPTSLIKVKDKEGLGPYDLLSATIADRTLRHRGQDPLSDDDDFGADEDEIATHGSLDDNENTGSHKALVHPLVDVHGDELYTFGSNKNLTLGFGDEDDRHFPERISLKRPRHLFNRYCRENLERRANTCSKSNTIYAEKLLAQSRIPREVSQLPSMIRSKPITIQDVQMAKFHTAVLTNDPVSNLYVCGHGLGGRLGNGNERTQFNFVCLEDFGTGRKKIVAVALGQDHSLAVSDQGELFTWGSNVHGQLGTGMPRENAKPEECIQLLPKQLFGPLKRETIIGVAASRIHSVAHTSTALFTFGRNEGQLGLIDAQARSLEMQATPRQVAASRFSCAIRSVSAIDKATICLLENHEVHVLANYGAVKLQFPLDGFANQFLNTSFLATKYDKTPNRIIKVTSGGDTICALSSAGEVFTVTVNQRMDPGSSSTSSTTNPKKIKSALSAPYRAWALKTDRMVAKDVGVDSDGSIILSTQSGSVWRRIRRPKASASGAGHSADQKAKDFKFLRVPNLTRAIAVRASASGAYCAIRQECDVTRTELVASAPTLWKDMLGLLPFKSMAKDDEAENPAPSFWQRPDELAKLTYHIALSKDVERDITTSMSRLSLADYDMILATSLSDIKIPLHSFILSSRSAPARTALNRFRSDGTFSSEGLSIEAAPDGKALLTLQGMDFLTMVELVLYLYTDGIVAFWQHTRQSPELAYRYRQVRTELMKIASRLDLRNLESAARRMVNRPELSLHLDMELALLDQNFFADGDAIIQLADGEMYVHSVLVSKRCPFFAGLFKGHAGGLWLTQRREELEDNSDAVQVDLAHIELGIFKLVLRHIYADTGEELFDDLVTQDLDEFLDTVMDVMSVANELMLDRLSEVCQVVLGRYVTVRNACQLLNAVAPSSVSQFKNATLEYLCLSLESVLCNHWLDELEEDLIQQLDEVVRENQLACLPIARSGQAEALLHEKYPELAGLLDRNRQAKLDSIALLSKFPDPGLGSPPSRSKPSPAFGAKSPRAYTTTPPMPSIAGSLTDGESLEPLPGPASADDPDRRKSPVNTTPPSTTGRPWGSSPEPITKLGIREIMTQASGSRTSNISLGLKAQAAPSSPQGPINSPRISQKERKRQQLQQQQEKQQQQTMPKLGAGSSPSLSSTPTSPWQTVPTSSRASISPLSTPPIRATRKASEPVVNRSPATPTLTMRQTIANAPAAKQKQAAAPEPSPTVQQRSVSSPQLPKRPSINTPGPSEPRGVPIQSIRHQPKPETPSGIHMMESLADIISQEQAEKAVIKEAAAKRSLQEIQEEQAFQEWWDQESKAVQEAASAAQVASNTRGRGGRRGHGGRRRGKEKAANEEGA